VDHGGVADVRDAVEVVDAGDGDDPRDVRERDGGSGY